MSTSFRDLLRDADVLSRAGLDARAEASRGLAARLGGEWQAETPTRGEDALPLMHAPTAARFVAVPGGRFEMGITDADLEEAAEHFDWTSPVAALVDTLASHARPTRCVEVLPFLVQRTLLSDLQVIRRLSGDRVQTDSVSRAEALSLASAAGFRLPSEAELEWLARDGGRFHFVLDAAAGPRPSRFGVESLFDGEWAADDWHPTYDGAPKDGRSWRDGDASGVYRGSHIPENMQSREELLLMLAGVRAQGVELPVFTGLRLTRALPA